MRLGGWKHETYDATLLKNEDREYELAKAPVKRLLKKGSYSESSAIPNYKITEAALLTFRKALEDYALELAKIAGINSRKWPGRNTLERGEILLAIAELEAPTTETVILQQRGDVHE